MATATISKLCLDPGHGGPFPQGDSGAVGKNLTREADITLAIGKRVSDLLNPFLEAIMTRTSDTSVALSTRADISNSNGADFFLSIHCNSVAERSVGGIESWCYTGDSVGRVIAKLIQNRLVSALGLADRGTKECLPGAWNDFYVLKHTVAPAVLVELGFISNPQEEALLVDPSFQDRAAMAIAQGVLDYVGVKLALTPRVVLPNGKTVKAVLVGNVLHVPVREAFTAAGYTVDWDPVTQTATIK